MMNKTCSKCGETKSVDAFSRRGDRLGGYLSRCKMCRADAHRSWRQENPGKQRAGVSRWRQRHPEQAIAMSRTAYWKNPEKARRVRRDSYYRHYDHSMARAAISTAIRLGRLDPAKVHRCVDCANAAHDYDHVNGYEMPYWWDVEPVCRVCHGKRTASRL